MTKKRLQLRRGSPPVATAGKLVGVASEIWGPLGVLQWALLCLDPPPLLHPHPHRRVRASPKRHRRRWVAACESPRRRRLRRLRAVQVVASPADLIKVRMQADGRLSSQGLQPRYSATADAFRKIIQAEGLLGLWWGVVPNAQRAFLVNMGELTCYDHAEHFIIRKHICDGNIYAHTLASLASGLCATTLSCPADVAKTRMMNQVSEKEVEGLFIQEFF